MKYLRSDNREKAIDGIKNAAWDMTYLSELARRMKEDGDVCSRYIFATGDRALAQIAKLIPLDSEPNDLEQDLARQMSIWWPERDVATLAKRFADAILVAASRRPPTGPKGVRNPIADLIVAGEAVVRGWNDGASIQR